MSIDKEILKIIEASVNKAVEASVNAIHKRNEEECEPRNYFRETEILLYNYPALKLKVDQDEEFLYDPDATAAPQGNKSKDIIRFSKGGGHGLDIDRYTQGVKSSMMRTRQEVLRIDRALETISEDKYFDIIPMKYFDSISMDAIAEALGKDETTCRRNKNRLVNKIKIMIFGADAL